MSEKDFLTDCLTKEAINPTLDKVKAECKIYKRPFSVLVIDVDHFKTYNDKYGHLDGDEVLRYFASTLRLSLREEEVFIFRFGGDEFILVFPGKKGKETLSVANNVMKNLKRRPFLYRGRIFKLSFSGGIASYPTDGNDVEEILNKGDKAMYFAKTHGRRKTILYVHILRKTIQRIAFILAVLLLVTGALFYFRHSSYRYYVTGAFKKQIRNVNAALTPVTIIKEDSIALDSIYLKSGRILRGVIIRDDKDEIELNLNLETGKGTITVKKAEIARIVPRPKKVIPVQNQK